MWNFIVPTHDMAVINWLLRLGEPFTVLGERYIDGKMVLPLDAYGKT